MNDELDYWNHVIKIKPLHLKKMAYISQIKSITNQLECIISDKTILINQKNTHDSENESYNSYKSFIDLMTNRVEAFRYLKNLFIDYKTWMYSKKIIPKLVDETNNIASYILRTSHILNYDIDSSNSKKLSIHWKTANGTNSSGILRSGGYVSFIFGLSIRMAISRIGASLISCNQIFIDEGFVAGSNDSLEKLPDFINHLKTFHNTILLVTHTDIIQQSSTLTVPILTLPDSQLSQIIFGKRKSFKIAKD